MRTRGSGWLTSGPGCARVSTRSGPRERSWARAVEKGSWQGRAREIRWTDGERKENGLSKFGPREENEKEIDL